MKNTLTYLLVFFCCLSVSEAQNGGIANNWYFGDSAGINFNTGVATSISSAGPIHTTEGCATISDINGNLLFSTDGITVYNSNNVQMPNGFGLEGHHSSTQSALIVPDPANSNLYYIFTVASLSYMVGGGLTYSVVNMTLAAGLGDVTLKNIPLVNPTTEKLTAVRHCNGSDYWVICHHWGSNAFYVYQVSASGISAPIISNVGYIYQGNLSAVIGHIKASPNGKRLAAVCKIPNNNIEIFDFDNLTGIISNPVYIASTGNGYGVAFSPDNTKLYVSFEVPTAHLKQYDLTAANIYASAYNLSNTSNYGALQLAPNGKIYGSIYNTSFLSVINNPNIAGACCNYVQNAIPLTVGTTMIGLPNFYDNFIAPNFSLGPDDTLCGDSTIINAGVGWASYLWSTGDTTQNITVNQAGQYWIEVMNDCGYSLRDTINIYPSPITFNLGNDTAICSGGSFILSPGGGVSAYTWSTGDTSSSITVYSSDTYWVTATSICGMVSDTIVIDEFGSSINYMPDTFVCNQSATVLQAAPGYISYFWNIVDTSQSIIATQPGLYYVYMTDTNGCIVLDSAVVTFNPNTVPSATFTALANNNMNGTYSCNFTYSSGASGLQSYWDFGDGTNDTSLLPPVHVYPCGQDFLVQHIIWNECGSDTFEVMVNAPCQVGVENGYGMAFSLYPNPINEGSFYIDVENREGNDMVFCLYDVMGKLVFSERLLEDRNRLVLPVGLGNGVYVGKVMDGNRVESVRVSVMR